MEDFRQQYDKMVIEQEKAKRLLMEQAQQLQEFRVLQEDHQILRQERDELQQMVHDNRLYKQSHEKQQLLTVESLEAKVDSLSEENNDLHKSLQALQETCERFEHEHRRLKKEVEEATIDRDHYKNELSLQESKHAEAKLHELKVELQQTMSDWQLMEQEKKNKEHVLAQITVEYNREKEKNVLQKMQLSLLEERVKVLTQELSVFRNLDVYHASMQQELDAYRTTSSKGGIPANSTAVANAATNANAKTITGPSSTSSAIGRLGPYSLASTSTSLPLPPHLSLTNRRDREKERETNTTSSTVMPVPVSRAQSRSRASSTVSQDDSERDNLTPVPVTTRERKDNESGGNEGKRLSLDDFSSVSPSPRTATTTSAGNVRPSTAYITVPVATIPVKGQGNSGTTKGWSAPYPTPPPPSSSPPPDEEDDDERGVDGNKVFSLQEMSVEEKERERDNIQRRQFKREQEEREKEMRERALRKAQREEQLRQMVLSQERDRLKLSQSRSLAGSSSSPYPLPPSSAPYTPVDRYAANQRHQRHNQHSSDEASTTSSIASAGLGSAPSSASGTLSRSALRTTNRSTMDIEKARKLLSM